MIERCILTEEIHERCFYFYHVLDIYINPYSSVNSLYNLLEEMNLNSDFNGFEIYYETAIENEVLEYFEKEAGYIALEPVIE